MWCIWRERNARNFEDFEKTSSDYSFVALNPSSNGSLLTPFFIPLTLQMFVFFFIVLDLDGCSFLFTFCVLGSRPFCL